MDNADTSGVGWRVGHLADAAGVTVAALHYYEQIGLLSPSQRSAGGHRIFNDDDIRRLYRIRVLREFGLSPAEMGPGDGGSDLDDLLRAHLRLVQDRLERLARLRDRLRAVCDQAENQPSAAELLVMLHAMSVVAGNGEAGSDATEDAADWRALGDELRRCLEAGDEPATPRVLEVARQAQERIAAYAASDPEVMEALAYLRRGTPRFDHAGWDLALIRFLNNALMALDEEHGRTS